MRDKESNRMNETVRRLLIYGEGLSVFESKDKRYLELLDTRKLLEFTILSQMNRSDMVLQYVEGKIPINKLRFWRIQQKRLEGLNKLSGKDIDKAFRFRFAGKFKAWLMGIDGIGVKKANMLLNILHRDFHRKFTGLGNIDIAPDIHTRRVFGRLGLSDGTVEGTIKEARFLWPQYPGALDLPTLQLGLNICKKKPRHKMCFMDDICPKIMM